MGLCRGVEGASLSEKSSLEKPRNCWTLACSRSVPKAGDRSVYVSVGSSTMMLASIDNLSRSLRLRTWVDSSRITLWIPSEHSAHNRMLHVTASSGLQKIGFPSLYYSSRCDVQVHLHIRDVQVHVHIDSDRCYLFHHFWRSPRPRIFTSAVDMLYNTRSIMYICAASSIHVLYGRHGIERHVAKSLL